MSACIILSQRDFYHDSSFACDNRRDCKWSRWSEAQSGHDGWAVPDFAALHPGYQRSYAYEHTDRPIGDICAEHGISSGTLRDRMRRWYWKRRRPPISRDGPPPVALPYRNIGTSAPLPACGERCATGAQRGWPGEGVLPHTEPGENAPHPMSSLRSDIDLSPHAGRGDPAATPTHPGPTGFVAAPSAGPAPSEQGDVADAEADAAAIVPRLRSAVARVLPAIEATIARLAAGPHRPREMEQAGRALSALTRTLRELNALLSQHKTRAEDYDDDIPEDINEFRDRLAQRIDAWVASRLQAEEEAKAEET